MSFLFTESGMLKWLGKLTAAAKALFPRESQLCLACAKRKRSTVAGGLALCLDCCRQIPWIREVVCPTCGRGVECPDCRRTTCSHYIISRSAVHYNALMKEWLARYKYRGHERLGQVIGGMMAHAMRLLTEDPAFVRGRFTVLVFVPVSESRLEMRGFNQSRQLAEQLAARFSLPVFALLERVKDTEKQSMKTRAGRFKNLRGAFSLNRQEADRLRSAASTQPPGPINVIIVDDVYTTGSTMQRCAQAVR
ncbi:MAG TPA: ComF family protein, partial [Bacilli bacterium]